MKQNETTSCVKLTLQKPAAGPSSTITALLSELLLCLSLCAGSWFSLLSMIDIPYIGGILFPLILLSPAFLYLLFKKINVHLVFIYLLLPIAALYVLKLDAVWEGYLLIANGIIDRMSQLGFSVIPFETSGMDAAVHVTMAITPAFILSAAFIVFGVVKRLAVVTAVFAALMPLLGVAFRIEPEPLPFIFLILGCVSLFVFCVAGAENISSAYRQFRRIPGVPAIVLSAAVALLCFFVLILLFPAHRYVPSPKTEQLKEEIISSADDLRYKNSMGSTIHALPFGNLKHAGTVMYTENTVMRVTMEKPRPVYLRSFTGSTYDDGKWRGLPPDAYSGDYTGIFLWLHHNRFYPQLQLGTYLALLEQAQTGRVTIENIALSSKYIFTPYESLPGLSLNSERVSFQKDDAILSRGLLGARQYSFDICLPPVEDYGGADRSALLADRITDTPEYAKYVQFERVYRSFVYNRYLQIPPNADKLLRDYFLGDALETMKISNRRQVVNMLRKYFSESFSYSLDVPASAEDDFIAGFLRDKEGYEIHFATLATLLLREAGIPARYVEGYYLSAQDTLIYTEMESIAFDVPDSSAHAWVEIYEDGIGWIPIEVTPGFYTLTKNEENTGGKQDILLENPKYLFLKDTEAVKDEVVTQPQDHSNGVNYLLLLIPLALLVLVAALLLWRVWYKKKIHRALTQRDSRKAALYMYFCLTRLLRFDGVKIDALAPHEVLEQANKKYSNPPGIPASSVLGYIYRARYAAAGHDIEKDELSLIMGYLRFLAEEVYKEQKPFKKALMIFLCLRYS
ncbi:MAG: Protein-glutamine gamma-glutamyltransferase [Pelotomaculum sp. PtaB.Bin104]|nr:MAG: Protein-glutamine gamma-glutamyltransferase [Pelotomaculum sp. PtaB.Bin104]